MRPRHLRIKGFTSFRDEQELDFKDLDLFALWGPTGSGKSSVLDAITYALYGQAERVHGVRDVSLAELVSHGQRRMAVTLEFEVGEKRLRVTRTTPRSGSSTARLEVEGGGEWRSYGEGADRVREVNRTIEHLIGLDYDAFTRSVILPQGKFAEFLTGDAAERRKILIELLGLELFGRMASHSNQIAREARLTVENTEQILAEQFAPISAETLADARRRAKDASRSAAEAEVVEKAVVALARRADDIERTTLAIERCSNEAAELAESFTSHARDLKRLAKSLSTVDERVETAKVDLEKAADAVEGAESDLTRAEGELGTRDSLTALVNKLEVLESARAECDAANAASASASARVAEMNDDLDAAEQRAAGAAEAAARARDELAQGRANLERARRKDLVAAVAADLDVGDPCPICGGVIRSLPEIERHALEAARSSVTKAEKNAAEAERATAETERALALARQGLDNAQRDAARCAEEASRRAHATTAIESEIGGAFDGAVPDDARAQIEGRVTDLETLVAALSAATESRSEAEKALATLERARDRAQGEVEAVRAAMRAARVDTLVKESAAALPGLRTAAPAGALPERAAQLAEVAQAIADALGSMRGELQAGIGEQAKERSSLLAQALEKIPAEPRPAAGRIADVVEVAGALRNRRRDESVRLATEAKTLAEQLARKRSLEAHVAGKRVERDLYGDLATELRTDRIVDYLQVEALTTLAANGSVHLERLSDHRYRLSYEDDRFYVIDAWNAEERRNVRTLSGGETFLASLALALALAEGVQMLAVTEKSRLESLFLDEGFGTLDAETLKAVVDALERLGGEDRLVGVVTHITALADEMPVRVEVLKSPRGSTLQVGTRELQSL